MEAFITALASMATILGEGFWPHLFPPRSVIPHQLNRWRTGTNPVTIQEDLFWPVGAPQRPAPETQSCPGCGSRQLTQRGSCAHCGTQRTSRPQREIKYIDVAGMTISEALETMETYRRQLRIQGSWSR